MKHRAISLVIITMGIVFYIGVLIGSQTAKPQATTLVTTPTETRKIPNSENIGLPAAKEPDATSMYKHNEPSILIHEPEHPITPQNTTMAKTIDSSHRYIIELHTSNKDSLTPLDEPIYISGRLEPSGDKESFFSIVLRHDTSNPASPIIMSITSLATDMTLSNEVYCFHYMKNDYFYDLTIQTNSFINCIVEREYERSNFSRKINKEKAIKVIEDMLLDKNTTKRYHLKQIEDAKE